MLPSLAQENTQTTDRDKPPLTTADPTQKYAAAFSLWSAMRGNIYRSIIDNKTEC